MTDTQSIFGSSETPTDTSAAEPEAPTPSSVDDSSATPDGELPVEIRLQKKLADIRGGSQKEAKLAALRLMAAIYAFGGDEPEVVVNGMPVILT